MEIRELLIYAALERLKKKTCGTPDKETVDMLTVYEWLMVGMLWEEKERGEEKKQTPSPKSNQTNATGGHVDKAGGVL